MFAKESKHVVFLPSKTFIQSFKQNYKKNVKKELEISQDKNFLIKEFCILQVTETGRRMKSLVESECIPSISQRCDCLGDWYKIAQTVFLQSQILDKDIDNYERTLESFYYQLSQEHKERQENFVHLIERLKEKPKVVTDSPDSNTMVKVYDMIEQISEIQSRVDNNAQLIERLEQLCNDYDSNSDQDSDQDVRYDM